MDHERRFRKHVSMFAVVVAGVVFLAAVAAVAADPAVTCATSKHKAATKKLSDKMKCHDKGLKTGEAVDPACLTKAEEKFNGSFAKAEGKEGCVTTGDAAAVEAIVDSALDDLLAALPASVPATCGILEQDCVTGEGCYLTAVSCVDGTGACSSAGTGAQGQSCTQHAECAPGLGCFLGPSGSVCLTWCESTTLDCPNGTICSTISGCAALKACI